MFGGGGGFGGMGGMGGGGGGVQIDPEMRQYIVDPLITINLTLPSL
jgi:hypothetical protein